MFDLTDYNAFKIEFDNTTENGNLDKFMAKYLNVDAVGLPIMSLIEPCERALDRCYRTITTWLYDAQNESSKEDERRRLES